jgi:hypothetical protein
MKSIVTVVAVSAVAANQHHKLRAWDSSDSYSLGDYFEVYWSGSGYMGLDLIWPTEWYDDDWSFSVEFESNIYSQLALNFGFNILNGNGNTIFGVELTNLLQPFSVTPFDNLLWFFPHDVLKFDVDICESMWWWYEKPVYEADLLITYNQCYLDFFAFAQDEDVELSCEASSWKLDNLFYWGGGFNHGNMLVNTCDISGFWFVDTFDGERNEFDGTEFYGNEFPSDPYFGFDPWAEDVEETFEEETEVIDSE